MFHLYNVKYETCVTFYKLAKLTTMGRHELSSVDHISPVISHIITHNERPSGDLYFTCVVTGALAFAH